MFKNSFKILLVSLSLLAGVSQAQYIRVPKNLTGLANSNQSYDFGDVLVGQTVYTTFTYKNESAQTLEIYDVSPNQGGAASVVSTTCGTYLAAQDTCTFTVGLYVGAEGTAGGAIFIKQSASATNDSLTVSANGVLAANHVYMTPATYAFTVNGEQKDLVLTNATSNAIYIGNVVSSKAQFSIVSNQCGSSVAANSTCTIRTKFNASRTGTYAGIISAISGGTTIAKASITGIFSYGVPSFSGDLNFSGLTAEVESAPKVATLTNIGLGGLYINNVTFDLPNIFILKGNNCPSLLAPGAACQFNVAAKVPASGGTYTGVMEASVSNAAGTKYYLNMYAESSVPTKLIQVTPSQLNFDTVNFGTIANSYVDVQSVGNLPVTISGYTLGGTNPGKFTIQNAASCTGALSPGNACTLSVLANTSAAGDFTGTIQINSDSTEPVPAIPLQISVVKPTLVATPASVSLNSFKGQDISAGTTVSNTGNTTASIDSFVHNISRAGVTVSGTCLTTTSLAAGQSCSFNVASVNPTIGTFNETATVSYGPGAQTLTIPVRTVITGYDVEMSDFTCAGVPESTPSTCTATLTNNTASAIGVSSLTRSGSTFGAPSLAGGMTLAANSSAVITLPFNIPTAGTYTTTVVAVTAKGTVQKTATALISSGPPAVASLGNFTCANTVPATAGSCTASLTNTSTTKALKIDSVASSNSAFGTPTHNCGASLAANTSCTVTLPYSGFAAAGVYSSNVTVNTTPTQVKAATVTVQQPVLTAPADYSTTVVIGSTANKFTLTFKNAGTLAVPVTGVALSNAPNPGVSVSIDSGAAQTCTGSIAAGASCVVNLKFDSNAVGQFTGAVTVSYKGGTASANVGVKVVSQLYTIESAGPKVDSAGIGSMSGTWYKLVNYSAAPITITTTNPIYFPGSTGVKIGAYTDTTNSTHCNPGKVVAAGGSCLFLEFVKNYGYITTTTETVTTSGPYIQLSSPLTRVYWTSTYVVKRANLSGTSASTYLLNATVPLTLSLTNLGDQTLSSITVAPTSTPAGLTFPSVSACSSLEPQQSCTVTVNVKPTSIPTGSSATMNIVVNGIYPRMINGQAQGAGNSVAVAKFSKGVTIVANAASWTVGKYAATKANTTAQATHTLTNKNSVPITIDSVELTGSAYQTLVSTTCEGVTLASGQSCEAVTQQNVDANRSVASATLSATNADGLKENATIAMNVAPVADLSVTVAAPYAAKTSTNATVTYTLNAISATGTATLTLSQPGTVTCAPATACVGSSSPLTIKYPATSGVVVTQVVSLPSTPGALTFTGTISSDNMQDLNSANDTNSKVTEIRGDGEWVGDILALSTQGYSSDNLFFGTNGGTSTALFNGGYYNYYGYGCKVWQYNYTNISTTTSGWLGCSWLYSHAMPLKPGYSFAYTTNKVSIVAVTSQAVTSTVTDSRFAPYAGYATDDTIYIFNKYSNGTGSVAAIPYSGTSLGTPSFTSPVAVPASLFGERAAFAMGPDGGLYAANNSAVFRINLSTGEITGVPSLAMPSGFVGASQSFDYSGHGAHYLGVATGVSGSGLAFDSKGRAMRVSNGCYLIEYPWTGGDTWGTPKTIYKRSPFNNNIEDFNGGSTCYRTQSAAGGLARNVILRQLGGNLGRAVLMIYSTDTSIGYYTTTLQLR